MASQTKEYSTRKLNGRVYTPPDLVVRILDAAGYCGHAIHGARILDPACGDGQFLVEIVRRIIGVVPREKLPAALRAIHGWDTDAQAVAICRARLDELIANFNFFVDWNVRVRNSLEAYSENNLFAERAERFDFVVGNPPYVRIQHLDAATRAFVQTHFQFCAAGSTDLYLAFFELALSLLTGKGVVAFVTPNSFFHTATGRALRRHLATNGLLRHIVNFGHRQVFPDASTYAAITVASTTRSAEFDYIDASCPEEQSQRVATARLSKQDVWRFGAVKDHLDRALYKPLKEIARIHVGLATLADSIYVVQSAAPDEEAADTVKIRSKHFGVWCIERELLRPVIKGSRVKAGQACYAGAQIIFPYQAMRGRPTLIPEDEMAARFPRGFAYLRQAREMLERRDNGRPNAAGWYAYGRTQALETGFGAKIICPPMATTPNFAVCEMPAATVYSGYFIKYDGDLAALARQLNAPRMQEWVQAGARDYRGGWKGYSKAALQDFLIDTSHL